MYRSFSFLHACIFSWFIFFFSNYLICSFFACCYRINRYGDHICFSSWFEYPRSHSYLGEMENFSDDSDR